MHANTVSRIPLDPHRIASISGALAVNGLLLLLLVAPMAPTVRAIRDNAPDVVFFETRKKENPPPPPRPEPIKVEVRNAPPRATAQPTHVVEPPPLSADDAQPGDFKVEPTTDAHVVADAGVVAPPDPGQPLAGAHLEYARNPPPPYPSSSLRAGEEGTVMLEVRVDVDGRPIEVNVARSSGYRALDAAARRQVLSGWMFRPAMRNGVAVQAIGLVPVEFKLD